MTSTLHPVVLATRLVALADALTVSDGGFTVHGTDLSDTVRTGYAVAIHPECEQVATLPVSAGDLAAYVAACASTLALPHRVLGGWNDPATGRVYLDVSVVVSDLSTALELATRHAQLAVFDLANRRSIATLVTA